jgi:hypothetical protein
LQCCRDVVGQVLALWSFRFEINLRLVTRGQVASTEP